MTARILVVDDLEPNVKLLEAKLRAEYFEVDTALDGLKAITVAEETQPDVILLDVMMPGIDGYEVCRRLKGNAATGHIPVVMVTALDQQSDRVAGLEAGADDFLTKPVEDLALFARVKSLARLKMMTDELRLRESTSRELGILSSAVEEDDGDRARLLIIEDQQNQIAKFKKALGERQFLCVEPNVDEALVLARGGDFDLIVVSLSLTEYDSLRFCSHLRSLEQTRNTPILVTVKRGDTKRLVRALDMGVNDYISRPVDENELSARVRTQLRRKRYTDRLRDSFQLSLEMAVTDQLTGLYNRRYLASHLKALFDRALQASRPLSLLVLDIDRFKLINDTHGHDVGDEVIRTFARRLAANVRGIDLACRYGGEEFVVAMPETDENFAYMVAERLRQEIAEEPIPIRGGAEELSVTVSIGVAENRLEDAGDTPQALIKRADEALYEAKESGRNRVVASAA